MMRKKFIIIIIMLALLVGCGVERYGVPNSKLSSIEELSFENPQDIVFFTYETYNAEQTHVLLDINTFVQYDVTNTFKGLNANYALTDYLQNSIIFHFGDLTYAVLNDGSAMQLQPGKVLQGITSDEQFIFENKQENNFLKCDLNNKCEEYAPNLEVNNSENYEVGWYHFFNDRLLYFGRKDEKINQLYEFNNTAKEWGVIPFPEYNELSAKLLYSKKDPDWIWFAINGQVNPEKGIFEDFNSNILLNVVSGEVRSIDAQVKGAIYQVKNSNMDDIIVIDRSTIVDVYDMNPDNFRRVESLSSEKLIPNGIQRINDILTYTDKVVVYSTPEGVKMLDKNTQEVKDIIFMDVNKT